MKLAAERYAGHGSDDDDVTDDDIDDRPELPAVLDVLAAGDAMFDEDPEARPLDAESAKWWAAFDARAAERAAR